jgi:arabinofuranosyltransferase
MFDRFVRSFATSALWVRVLVLLALAVVLFVGWRTFWFLTDDAYITFRYIDHHRRGWGYVWNPPPFVPVEGYSNFLWAVLLEGVWVLTGQAPPRAANVVSLVFSCATLALTFLAVWRAPLPASWQPRRFWLAALVLLYTVTHRTFLTWTSSGLETALFGFCASLWLLGMLEFARHRSCRAFVMVATGAAAAALTRPDGLMLVAAVVLAAAFLPRRRRSLFCLLPLLAVLGHLLWRRAYYGDWVPNTFYAKLVSAWPDAGMRYCASFILEHAVWAWLLPGLVSLGFILYRIQRDGLPAGRVGPRLPLLVAVAACLAHVIYYAIVVGGDHFEYRPFAFLVPFMALALARFVVALPGPPVVGAACFLVVWALAQPIPWVHFARTRPINTRDATFKLFVPVADAFPAGPLRRYARQFDRLQTWMMARHVGTRHQEHKVFWLDQIGFFPTREQGSKISWGQRALTPMNTVGVPGWTMPEVAFLDIHGLNDRVIARNPVGDPPAIRLMAHERTPPPGYIDCFQPNLTLDAGRKVTIIPRKTPLSDAEIRRCEQEFFQRR